MGELLRRIWYVLRYRARQNELAEELEFHREMKRQQLVIDGMDPAMAAVTAQNALGNDLTSRQRARDVWIPPRLHEMVQDIRFAARLLVKDRGFATTAIVVLGLGIGVNNMMFTIIYAHTLRSLPIPQADRVLYISTFDDRTPDRPLAYPELLELRAASSFEDIAAFVSAPIAVGDEGRAPDRFDGAYATANAFDVIGRQAVLGRSMRPADDSPDAPLVALLSSDAWRTRYNEEPDILGRTILADGSPATVVGIMPARSGFPSGADIWLPLSHLPGFAPQKRDARVLRAFGRLRDGVEEREARLEVETIVARSAREHPETSRNLRARVVPINERFLGQASHPGWLSFLLASVIVVVVSAANVANLMIARSARRTREIAIRVSLGAGRWRVVRQMLVESVVLAGLAGAIALGLSIMGVRLFRSGVPSNTLPYWFDYSMDARVFMALLAVAFGTVLVFGLVPAFQSSRTDVNRVLKDGGRAGTGTLGARRWTAAFLAGQFALTVVLLVNAVVAFRTQSPEVPSDTVIKTTELLTASVTLPPARYPTTDQQLHLYAAVRERLQAAPGVAGVTVASVLPSQVASERQFELESAPGAVGEDKLKVGVVSIGPAYFQTLSVPMERGREFDGNDGEPGRERVIVNQRFAEMFLAGQDPIGQRLGLTRLNETESETRWASVIGVAQNVRQSPSRIAGPLVYVPFRPAPPATASLIVRSTMETTALTSGVREALRAIDPGLPLYRAMTMKRAIDEAEWNGRLSGRLALSVTLLALALSVVGLYAVTAYAVAQRTHEIGIRMALGARPVQLGWFVARRAALQVGWGLLLGVLFTFTWDALLTSGRFDIRFASPGNLIPVAALLSGAVFLASFVPARRAARLDPAAVLRGE
jgi:putative ABC transport system permease protein